MSAVYHNSAFPYSQVLALPDIPEIPACGFLTIAFDPSYTGESGGAQGEEAFKLLKGDNKELVIVPGASHCDLYDGGGKGAIPFDRIEAFYRKNLK